MSDPGDLSTSGPIWEEFPNSSMACENLLVRGQLYAAGGITPPPGGLQVFRYTADGTEPLSFAIALPTARLNANYNVQVGMLTATAQLSFSVPVVGITATQFTLVTSAALTAGDVLAVTVEDLT